jgi:FAD-linked oxidoreductase
MLISDTNYAFHNWDHTLECHPRNFYQPRSEQEVVDIVRQVEGAGGMVRAFGAGHSWSALALTDETLINLDRLNQLVAIDAARKRVTVQAAIRIKELNQLLPAHGLAMANLGSIAEQSIAGATATGTHGTGLRFGSMHTQLVGMKLVTGGGQLVSLTEEQDPELMRAARVSLGALGIVTEVTIQCLGDYNLEWKAWPRPFEEVLNALPELIKSNDRVRLYWFAGSDVIQTMTMNHTDLPVTPKNRFKDWFTDIVVKHDFMKLLMETGYHLDHLPGLHVHVDATDDINRFEAKVGWVREERVDRYNYILNIPMPPEHQECEYAVPVARAAEAVRLTRQIIEANNYHVNLPIEVRFVAADESMLSPAYGQDVCYVGAYTFGAEFAAAFFAGFEPAMKSLGGRPHWGKHITLTGAEARGLYPLYDRFNEIRRQLDPNGTFANRFIHALFSS